MRDRYLANGQFIGAGRWHAGLLAEDRVAGVRQSQLLSEMPRHLARVVGHNSLSRNFEVVGIWRIQPRELHDILQPLLKNRPRDSEPLAPFGGVIEPARW